MVLGNPNLGMTAPMPRAAPGLANDTTADRVLGQLDFVHNIKNLVDGRGFNMSNITGDIAVDRSVTPNRVYVTDTANNRVLGWSDIAAFATHAEATIVIGQPDLTSNSPSFNGITATSLNNPSGLAVDNAGNLFIVDTNNHRVLYYKTPFTTDKAADDVFGQLGSFNTNFCNGFGLNENSLCTPVRVAVDAANNVYITDQSNHRVLAYRTPQVTTALVGSGDTTADKVIGQSDSFNTQSCNNPANTISAKSLCFPVGIATDAVGSLFVADFSNNRVLKFNTPLTTDTTADRVYGQSNAFTTGIANKTGINGVSMSGPMSVVVAPDNAVYISERNNHRVLGYPVTGVTSANKVLGQFGSLNLNTCNNSNFGAFPPINARSLCNPDGLALDKATGLNSPNLYVVDASNNRALQYKPTPASAIDPTLTIKNNHPAGGVVGQTLFTTGLANALDGRGFAFSDISQGNIAIDRSVVPNRVYVSDYPNNRVLAWNDIAAFTTRAPATLVFGQPNVFDNTVNNGGISATSLSGPRGIAVDSLGNLYVADQNNHRILEYNTPFVSGTVADKVFGQSGNFTFNFCNQSGVNANSLCTPTGLAVDTTNNLYVADFSNSRVLKYNTPLTTNTTADKVYGQGNNLLGQTCNLGGITANGLCNPSGVAIDSANNVYVSDFNNNRVLEFNALPAVDTTADKVFGQGNLFTTNTCNIGGVTSISLCRPRYLSVNSLGHLFVGDTDNTRVLKFNSPLVTDRTADRVFGQSNLFTTNGCKTLSPNSLCGVDGVAVDSSDNLYIIDASNNRVLNYLKP